MLCGFAGSHRRPAAMGGKPPLIPASWKDGKADCREKRKDELERDALRPAPFAQRPAECVLHRHALAFRAAQTGK
jgi:hypothetical protein